MNKNNHRLCFLNVCFSSFASLCGAVCMWPNEFQYSTWRSNRHGFLTFDNTSMVGWNFTVDDHISSTWQCMNGDLFQTEGYLMMRSETHFDQFVTSRYWAYLCIRLEKVTLNSYRYYVEEPQQRKMGNERFIIYPNSTLSSKGDICHPKYGAVGSEYGILIKAGSEGSVSITCPWTSLGRYDYTYMTSDDLVTCEGKGDSWNSCVDETKMVFYLVSCATKIVNDAGAMSCIDSVQSKNATEYYVTLFNNGDVSHSIGSQFSCLAISSDMSKASVAPGYCRQNQTAASFPVNETTGFPVNETTKDRIGFTLTLKHKSETCLICQVPPYDGNVTVVNNGTATTAFYSCAQDYSLHGDAQRTCQKNNTWSGQEPKCVCKSGDTAFCNVNDCRGYNTTELLQCCETCSEILGSLTTLTSSTYTFTTSRTASSGSATRTPPPTMPFRSSVTKETLSGNVCPLFEASGGCESGSHCENQDGKPVCVQTESKVDNTVAITVGTVCSVVFLALVVVGVVFILRRFHGRRPGSTNGSAFYIHTDDISNS